MRIRESCKEAKRATKRAIAKPKSRPYENFYKKLDTRRGNMYS